MITRFPLALRTWFAAILLLSCTLTAAQPPLTLGVFAHRPVPLVEQQFAPLADYLADALERDVHLLALQLDDMELALAQNRFDLLLTNPAHFVLVRNQSMLASILATVVNIENDRETTSLGGVIITLAERDDINTLADLRSKRIGIPGTRFLGGFQTQFLELLEAGIALPQGERLKELGSHDHVIDAVLQGQVDVGFIRTGIIESLVATGQLDPDALKIINPQRFAGFPYQVSTRLYPEWAFVALPSVDRTTLRRISQALLTLDAEHPAARAAEIGGFVPPADYSVVEQLARRLRMPPYDAMPTFTFSDVWQQYRVVGILGVAALAVIVLLSIVLLLRNRQLSVLGKAVRDVFAQREELVRHVPGTLYQFRMRADGTYHFPYSSSGIREIYGVTPEQVLHDVTPVLEAIHPEDTARILDSVRASATTLQTWHDEYRVNLQDGRTIWVEGESTPQAQPDGSVLWHGYIRNITKRKQNEENLRLAATVFSHAREGILITDRNGTIIDANPAFTTITGYARDEVLGQNPRILNSGRHDAAFYADMWHTLLSEGQWYGELWNRRKDGGVYAEMLTISAVHDDHDEVQNYIAVFSDITALKEHQLELERIAHYDTLTGLPNRLLLGDRLRQAMVQAQRRGQRLAVCFLDLDGFKAVNDTHGHTMGDHLLAILARRMEQVLRDGDTLSRPGGDEFVAVLADLPDVESCIPILTRLIETAARPVPVDEAVLEVTASVGVTFYPQVEAVDADQLLRQADQAMYQAKQAGKNRYHIFDAELDRDVRNRHETLECIRTALTHREFVLYYQPKVNMRTGELIGVEALIRWQHPQRGLLPPAAFLPIIEGHPLAIALGEWVIEAALAQIEHWQSRGLSIEISANISAQQLQHPDFISRLHHLLGRYPSVPPSKLSLEVLETSALEDFGVVSKVMYACLEMGINFALDDFGTGYSSLSYLKRLPAELLKIDRSFVRDMLDDPEDLAILEGVLGLARAFRRRTIAEGVETLPHGEMLLRLGCELGQGYVIARPMPAEDIEAWMATWQVPASWNALAAVSPDRIPVLFAAVEHRAWITALENYLTEKTDAPPQLDEHQCRFGHWLDHGGSTLLAGDHPVDAVKTLHSSVHHLAAELIALKRAGNGEHARARLGEVHDLRDQLVAQLIMLNRAG